MVGVDFNPLIAFMWSLFVGTIFSTVGAAGGILAGVGHISVLGIPHANTIKLMNQILIFTSTVVAVPAYLRQRRLIVVLSVLLGIGSIVGAMVGSTISYKFLPDLKNYKYMFGLFTILVAVKIFHETFSTKKKESIKAIEEKINTVGSSDLKTKSITIREVELEFMGEAYSFNPAVPVLAGFTVAIISSTLGVGGGFLLVPFITSVMGIPMFLVPGTSALAILITMIVSAGNYLKMGATVYPALLAIEVTGVVLGSIVGPYISKALREKKLRLLLATLLTYIGVGYTLGDFIKRYLGIRII